MLCLNVWLIRGWIIWFSDENDCKKNKDTFVAEIFMMIFLVTNIPFLCISFAMIIGLPFGYFCGALRDHNQARALIDEENRYEAMKEADKSLTCGICKQPLDTEYNG